MWYIFISTSPSAFSSSNSLETNGRLMQLNHADGKLYVNYGDRLVSLMRETRTLTSLGFVVPQKIRHTTEVAEKFYHHGIVLKQVVKSGHGNGMDCG